MALKINFNDGFGGVNPEAYAKIVELTLNAISLTGQVKVWIYRNQTARQEGKNPLGMFMFDMSDDVYKQLFINEEGTIAKIYEWIKTKTEFANSIDC